MSDPITPLSPAQTSLQEQQASKEDYFMRNLIQLDMLGNTLVGGRPDETISTDTGLLAQKHEVIGSLVCHLLDFFQKNHGAKAAAGDLERAQSEVIRLEDSGVVGP
jgi:hypothetical protein